MTATNAAARLDSLIDTAQQYGTTRPTSPALEVWLGAMGVGGTNPHTAFQLIASVHRTIERMREQMAIANPKLLAECGPELGAITQAFTMAYLEDSWNNTRRLLGSRVHLSVKAFSAALDGRFDEGQFDQRQVDYAISLLHELSERTKSEHLAEEIESFLLRSIDQLLEALHRMHLFGAEEFTRFADHVVADLGRALASGRLTDSLLRRTIKMAGVTIASISAAATMGLGVVDLDQKTIDPT